MRLFVPGLFHWAWCCRGSFLLQHDSVVRSLMILFAKWIGRSRSQNVLSWWVGRSEGSEARWPIPFCPLLTNKDSLEKVLDLTACRCLKTVVYVAEEPRSHCVCWAVGRRRQNEQTLRKIGKQSISAEQGTSFVPYLGVPCNSCSGRRIQQFRVTSRFCSTG